MQPTPTNPPKSKLRNRAKALAVLLSPFLAAAALTALLLAMRQPQSPAEQTKQSGWLSPTSSGASVDTRQTTQGATTVTTYTVTGEY